MAQKLIVIVSITSKQGASAARTYLSDPAWRVRGLTRNPNKPEALEWAKKGVEVVRTDLNDLESVKAAFAGANAIFAVTNTVVDFEPEEMKAQQEALGGVSIATVIGRQETQQGMNMALAAASLGDSLERYVFSTLANATRWSKGKYTHAYNFDAKAAVTEYIQTAPEMAGLRAKTSFFQLGHFLENWRGLSTVFYYFVRDPATGKFYHPGPGNGDEKIPFVSVNKDTGKIVQALVDSEPGKNVLAYGSYLSWHEFMSLWAKTVGAELLGDGFKSISYEETIDLVEPDWFKKPAADFLSFTAEFGVDGSDPSLIHPKDVSLAPIPRPCTTGLLTVVTAGTP